MQNFNELILTVEKLISPGGCQWWDRNQTLSSLRPYLIEEVYEIIEAIDLDDSEKILEEVGDVFFHLVFIYSKCLNTTIWATRKLSLFNDRLSTHI